MYYLFFDFCDRNDRYCLAWDIWYAIPSHDLHSGDGIYNIHSCNDLTKDAIAIAITFIHVIEIWVIHMVDKKLGRSTVWIGHPCHRDGPSFVAQSIIGLVLDWSFGGLLAHVGRMPSTLDHEAFDYAMKDSPIIKSIVHISEEILHRYRCLIHVQLKRDITHRSFHKDFGIFTSGCVIQRKCQ